MRKIGPVLEERARRLDLPEFELVLNGARIAYFGGSINVEPLADQSNGQLGKRDWSNLILGVLDPRDVVGLRGHPELELIRILFPQQHPQVPLLDQF